MPELAAKAKKLGAQVIIVHGESPVEPVEEGTNEVAVNLPDVDILAHPGNKLTVEEAEAARENGVLLELTSRRGHRMGNKHVARVGLEAKASFIVNTDAHQPEDLITVAQALALARSAGLPEKIARDSVSSNPRKLIPSA
jgi:histidinol phosphatase-like PHP family hydrolase